MIPVARWGSVGAMKLTSGTIAALLIVTVACSGGEQPATDSTPRGAPGEGTKAFVGARLIDGTGAPPISDAVLLVRDGRVQAAGTTAEVAVPDGAETVDVAGRTIFPGLINTHGHVGDTAGLEAGHYSEENVLGHLALYARYGVTTVNSLGGDEALAGGVRAAEGAAGLARARLMFAGPVVSAATPEEAAAQVDEIAAMNPDFVKIRVDDNLGATPKMTPAVYTAVIEAAHRHGLPLAAHLFYLEDAKGLLAAGADFIAHSVRDRPVDEELIDLLVDRNVCYSPTLVREVSTFVYEERPAFFDDPLFTAEADPAVVAALEDPARQARYRGAGPTAYKQALQVAQRNLKAVSDGGVTVAMGTDSGPPARFQGYFEHLELALMAEAGLTPMQILVAATGDAARCLQRDDIGTLQPGRVADFVVVTADPLADITNTRSIESVWIAGNRVPR